MTVALPAALQHGIDAWSSMYNDHTAVRIGVTFCHLAGLMAGGGLAVAADRATLRLATRSAAERTAHLDELHAIHRVVISGLVVTFVSGLLLLGADLETLTGSRVFWTKMGLVTLLIANGALMRRAEEAARTAPSTGWPRLHRASLVSLILWFAIVFAGTVLTLDA